MHISFYNDILSFEQLKYMQVAFNKWENNKIILMHPHLVFSS